MQRRVHKVGLIPATMSVKVRDMGTLWYGEKMVNWLLPA